MTTKHQAIEQLQDYWRKLPERLLAEDWNPAEEAKRLELLAILCREAAGLLPLGDDLERLLYCAKQVVGIPNDDPTKRKGAPQTKRNDDLRRAAFALERDRLGHERHGHQFGERRRGRPGAKAFAGVQG